MNVFNYVSLFSGIGGFEKALDSLGGICVMSSDNDIHANNSYQALYGKLTSGDITDISEADVPDHDILTAGFPCQTYSLAGKGDGFDDIRGTMFFEVMRIANYKKPKIILIENVKGLIMHDKGNTLNVMLKKLTEIGYSVDFNLLDSKDFNSPQVRERIYIIAVRSDIVSESEWNVIGTKVIDKGRIRINKLLEVSKFQFDFPSGYENKLLLRDLLEYDVLADYYISEENTELLLKQLDFKTEKDKTKEHKNKYFLEFKGRRELVLDVLPILTPDRIKKRQEGRRFKNNDEPSFTQTAQDKHGVAIKTMLLYNNNIEYNYRIRRLTPRECWRLQGFSDADIDRVKSIGMTDAQMYKQAGNAVTVNVVHAIAERLICYL